jgi:hypothetical protein
MNEQTPKGLILPDWLYQLLKWIAMILLPAAQVLYVGLAGVWGWPLVEEISTTMAAVNAFLGAMLGISSASYYKSNN